VRSLARLSRSFFSRSDAASAARRGSAAALLVRLANAALAYLAQVVLARLMGQFEYGVFAYTWVWFMVFTAVSTLGFGNSPLRYIAELKERGEAAHLRGFLLVAPIVVILVSVATGVLLVLALPLAARWIGEAYLIPMMLMALAVPFACMQCFLEAVDRSFGWTVRALLPIYILRHALLLLFMVAAVWLGFEATAANGFVCLVAVLVVSLVYQAVDLLIRLRRVLPAGPRSYRVREWIGGSVPFAVLYGASHLTSFADILVLSFFVSPAEIAVYFAATRIIQVVNLVPFAATVGTAHLLAASHTRGDQGELQRLTRHVAVTTFAVAGLAVAVIIAAGDWLLAMFGQGYEAGYMALAILALGIVARVAAGPAEDVLNMTGNGSLSAKTYLVVVAVNVALAVALVIPFGIGGAAAASAISLALRAAWLSAAVGRRLRLNTSIFSTLPSWSAHRVLKKS